MGERASKQKLAALQPREAIQQYLNNNLIITNLFYFPWECHKEK